MAKRGSHGGQVTASRLRQKALDAYYRVPNSCKRCGSVIEVPSGVKVTLVRKKVFCNRSCAARHNNHVYPKRKRTWTDRPLRTFPCRKCGEFITSRDGRRKYCDACKATVRHQSIEYLDVRTKGELFAKNINWQSARSSLRRHAYKIYNRSEKPKNCVICQYSLHVDIAHVRPVRHFPDNAHISEINDLSNLVALCPNHHWEFDHGLLELPGFYID
jgi:hypothetical protein